MRRAAVLAALALAAGCASYTWQPQVPAEVRTVAVPTFRNESEVTELGDIVARQVLREFQREGTYRIARLDECALEVQGVVKTAGSSTTAYDRRTNARNRDARFTATALVSFIDKSSGRVLADNRVYTAQTTFFAGADVLTGERDASGRLAEDLARQIVDDALSLNWQDGREEK